ncbi:hypothetical protein ABXT52_05370 [Candidatus Pelagibacter sp. Uisw_121]|uniref:hypothetical protein n=1 Tax=Candidatus Pelagibacter sp. Uisw_121 TaxID=3230987 RepID=UPI0039EA94D0
MKNISFIFILLFCSFLMGSAYSENITEANTVNSTSNNNTTQKKFIADYTSLTISESTTLSTDASQTVNIFRKNNGTVTVESGSSIFSNGANSSNTIQGRTQSGLTVTNSGTISAGNSKAINLLDATNSIITNNTGGIIKSNTNTITVTATNDNDANNVTINNSGEIYAYSTDPAANSAAIKSEADTDNITIINNSGGYIHSNSGNSSVQQGSTVFISSLSNATLTNSGTIENKAGVNNYALGIAGSGVTVTLRDKGKVIGKINVAGSGHTIKLQHGAGQAYFYDIDEDGTYDLEDLDGNPVVKGSAGSIGQGGNEMLDETLSYKSLNMRKSLIRFKKSEAYLNQDEWGEFFTTFNKRKENKSTLRLGSKTASFGANIIEPISENKNFILSVETGSLNIAQGHDINKVGFLTGLHFNEVEIFNINPDLFILGGANYNKSDRNILTNTTTTGEYNITDLYENYEFLIGAKTNLNSLFPDLSLNNLSPDISLNFGYSYTPSHEESKYFKWEDKDIYNGSIALSDEYEIINNEKTNFYISWIADARSVLDENVQVFYVNGVKGSYSQNNDLKNELSLSAGLNYEYKFSKNNIFLMSLDGLQTSQHTRGIQANLNYISKF